MARTLVDLAGALDAEAFEVAAESAFRKNRFLYPELVARLEELGAQGRNGTAVLREFLANRSPDAPATEGVLETKFLRLLRSAGMPDPVRQHVVQEGARFVTRLDFCYLEVRFGIRLNGKATHLHAQQWQKDQSQGNDLTLLDWTILDFTWEDVADRPEQVLALVRRGHEVAAERRRWLGNG